MKSRSRQIQQAAPDSLSSIGFALYRAGLLAAVFLSPLLWGGRQDALSGGLIFSFLCLSAGGWLLCRPARLFPAGLPLSAFHLALAGLLLISLISYFPSYSRHASSLDLIRLISGALIFLLALQERVLSSELRVPRVEPAPKKQQAKAKAPSSKPSTLPAALLFLAFVVIACLPQDWNFFYEEILSLILRAVIGLAALALAFLLWKYPTAVGVLETALVSSGIVAAYGLLDWLYMRLVAQNTTWNTFSTFVNTNTFAGFLGIAFFLALIKLAQALRSKAAKKIIFPALVSLLILLALPLTSSKGALVSVYLAGAVFLISLTLIFCSSRPRRMLLIGLILLVMFVAPAGLVVSRPSLHDKAVSAFSLQKNDSNMFRYLTWKGTGKMIADHPWLGVGAGAFEYAFSRYAIAGYTRRAHQNYLETAADTGWIGFCCFVWMMLAAGVGLIRAARRAQDRRDKLLASGALCAALVMIFHSFLDFDWFYGANTIFFFAAVGLGFSSCALPSEKSSAKPVFKARSVLVMLVLLALAVKAILIGVAEADYNKADQLRTEGNFWEARDYLKQAISLDPTFGKAYWLLGATSPTEEGIALEKRAIALEPGYSSYLSTLAKLRQNAGDMRGAAEAYEKATELNPQQLSAWIALAAIRLQAGKPKAAVEDYRRVVEIQQGPAGRYQGIDYEVKTEYADAHYGLALARLKGFAAGGEKAAWQELQQAVAVLDEYQLKGGEFEKQRRSIGEGEPGKEEKVALLRAKCYYRMSEIARAQQQVQAATKWQAQAMGLSPDIEQIISAEDKVWSR